MRMQSSSLYRWIRLHRRQLLVTTALIVVAATLLFAAPILLLLAWAEHVAGSGKRPLALSVLYAGGRALLWLVRDLAGLPQGRWHPCAQCGLPILEPSRAAYCSHACRNYARLERDAEANDPRIADRAQRRLRAIQLRQLAEQNPEWTEIPF